MCGWTSSCFDLFSDREWSSKVPLPLREPVWLWEAHHPGSVGVCWPRITVPLSEPRGLLRSLPWHQGQFCSNHTEQLQLFPITAERRNPAYFDSFRSGKLGCLFAPHELLNIVQINQRGYHCHMELLLNSSVIKTQPARGHFNKKNGSLGI